MREFIEVDPRLLHLPPSRASGSDPVKLQRQIVKFGGSAAGMPPVLLYRGSDGEFMIFDGVTRATRLAGLRPGEKLNAEVVGDLPAPCGVFPTVGERLP